MAGQILSKTAQEAATFKLSPLDLLFIVDENGDRTGELRIGDGITAGGYAIDGVAGGVAGVTTWNNASGTVSAGINDLNDVDTSGAATDDVLKYTSLGGFAPGKLDLDNVEGVSTAGAEEGKVLMYDDKGVFSPADLPAAEGDGLGDHQATQDLQMNNRNIRGARELNFGTDGGRWTFGRFVTTGQMAVVRRDNQNVEEQAAVFYAGNSDNGQPNLDGLVLPAYGAFRLSDATGNNGGQTSTPVTNLAYFSSGGQLLKAPINEVSIGKFSDVDLTSSAPEDGQVLAFNSTSGNFEPANDGMGDHTATQTLDLNGESLEGAFDIGLSGDDGKWQVNANIGGGRLAFARRSDGTNLSYGMVLYQGFELITDPFPKPNQNGLVLPAYGAARLSDATGDQGGQNSTPVTNLAYFSNIGQLLRAPTDDVSIGVFGDVDLTSIAAGDMLYYDGSGFVRVPKGTDGQTLTLVSGVPTWA